MNITPWLMYLITRLDDLNIIAACIGIPAFIVAVLAVIMWAPVKFDDDLGDKADRDAAAGFIWRILKTASIIALCGILLDVLLPTRKEMIAILAVPAVVNSQVVQKDLPELYRRALAVCMDTLEEKTAKKEDGKEKHDEAK